MQDLRKLVKLDTRCPYSSQAKWLAIKPGVDPKSKIKNDDVLRIACYLPKGEGLMCCGKIEKDGIQYCLAKENKVG